MSKKATLQACDAAMEATNAANKKNDSAAHSEAASLHRIAAEHAKLNGEDALHEKHKSMAVEHDLCASRCLACEKHSVKVPEMTPQEVAARKAEGLEAFQAAPNTVTCKHCGHEFEAKKFEQGDVSGVAICPDCKGETKVDARSGKSDSAEHDDLEVKCGACGKQFDATEDKNYGSGTVTCPGCDNSVQVSTSKVVGKGEHAQVESRKAFIETVNRLSANRMTKKAPLMAALAGEGISLNDLNTEVREAVQSLALFKCGPNQLCSSWVTDIVAPDHEEGETWSAIVQGNDQKLYAVEFTIENESVKLAGEPKEVERVTDYDFVADMANEAKKAADKAALEAGGSSEGTLKGHATKKTAAAEACSVQAEDASKKADASGLVSDHKAAHEAHDAAADAHMAAMKAHVKADSDDNTIEKHHAAAIAHKAQMAKHAPMCADDATDDSMTAKVHRALESLKASGSNPTLRDVRSFMWREHKVSMGNDDVARELATPLKAKANGYGACPKCGNDDSVKTSRERSPNGSTTCGACGVKTKSTDWK